MENIEEVLNLGVENIVMGTAAVQNISLLEQVSNKYPNRVSVGMDTRKGLLALKGWTDQTQLLASDFANQIKNFKIKSIIFTDIDKDGTKEGVNLIETEKLANLTNIPVVASGGVAKIDDVVAIKKTKKIAGVIIGKAIYDQSINLNDLVKII